jgi:hypothetical protein
MDVYTHMMDSTEIAPERFLGLLETDVREAVGVNERAS